MATGSLIEFAVPGLLAGATALLMLLSPTARNHRLVRGAMMLFSGAFGIEVLLAIIVYGAFFLTGGMENF